MRASISAYCFLRIAFSNSITKNTITPVPAAMDRSHPLKGMTSKKLLRKGIYKTINCKTTTNAAIPASNGLPVPRNLKIKSIVEREAII